MTIYRTDPLADPRWGEFVVGHPRASVFHTPGWLGALRTTFGYRPVVYTTTPPGRDLANGIVLCDVQSRLTGRRLVSLPFSDHCEPLAAGEDAEAIVGFLRRDCVEEGYRYLELRPRTVVPGRFGESAPAPAFRFHRLSLEPDLAQLFDGFHVDCVRRKIRRGSREALTCQEGRSPELLAQFYHLLLLTCRRRQLPPHPRAWFTNLVAALGDRVTIRVASKDGRPIASILTLTFNHVLVYKYACSDERFHNLGAMQVLLWNAITHAKTEGLHELDLGRSDLDASGLIAFKDRWGAVNSELTYWRYAPRPVPLSASAWRLRIAKRIFARLPAPCLATAGRVLYKHVG